MKERKKKEISFEQKLKNFIIPTLRRASYRWFARSEALKSARIERGLYKCAGCQNTFRNKEIQLDHIQPVVDLKTGFDGWDSYIKRMFCNASGYQVLCDTCHDVKSDIERNIRLMERQEKKKNVKKTT